MDHPIKFLSLQKSELEYEVGLRGDTPADNVAELRKQITKSSRGFTSEDILESHLEPSDDLKGARECLVKSQSAIAGLKTKYEKNLYLRTENLLNHIYHRLTRITPKSPEDTSLLSELNKHLNIQFKDIKNLAPVKTTALSEEDVRDNKDSNTATNIAVTCDRGISSDLFKLKFDGKTCVRSFIEKVEEFIKARNISSDKVLSFAAEIFTENALHWFRSIRDTVNSWEELVILLKKDFGQFDYDYRLMSEIQGNILYRYMKCKNALLEEFSWKQVIPSEQREKVIADNHAQETAAHLGVFKTYRRLLLRYYWPGMYSDVVKFVTNCQICLAYKLPTHGTLGKMGRPKECSRPFQTLSIDLVGPLPASRKQNCYLFVITCCFSKYCLLFPLRQATATAICKILEDNVFLIHGIPQTIIMDNGSQFISKQLDTLLGKYKVPNIHFTPKYTPQVNTVERYNKTIITAVSTLINNDHRAWDTVLPKIQFAINNSVNEVTGYTPSFLVHGRELVCCGSHYVDNDVPNEITFLPRDVYAENLGHLGELFNKVQAALWHSHQKTTQRYNLRRKDAEFSIGDIVWKRCFFQSDKSAHFAKKLAPKFEKCRIIGKRSPLVYILEDKDGRDIGAWHIKDLKIKSYNV
ncbi:hypothetical protein ABMA27_015882 [Loxostege sticticalis]|uniref:RNA-directed DNA polymerase n=1 Tax=Loxostege sticticalis TaxID=481309 RepID=A0ABR3I4V2_LOXSC